MRSNECTHNHVAAETPSTPSMASPTPTTSTPSSPAATTSSSSYHYTHLERDQIRLVVLEPATTPSDPLVCRILTCHRNDAPPYEAMSFTPPSEDDKTTSTITVLPPILAPTSPTPLEIPSSTAEALTTLRLPTNPRTLYIPALSINASSPSERSSQLLLAPSIYRAATRVTIPLLSPVDHTEAITYISSSRFRNPSPSTLALLRALFAHPYFSSTPAILHLARARNAVILHRNIQVPLSNFSLAARLLPLHAPILQPIRRLKQRGYISTLTTAQFVKALCEASPCTAPDPRDRVFAFLALYPFPMTRPQIDSYRRSGFSSGDGPLSASTRVKGEALERVATAVEAIEDEKTRRRMVNYTAPVETIYTTFATLLLETTGLDFLSAVQGKGAGCIPSWVPDWRVPHARTILAHLPLTEFNAGGAREQAFRVLPAADTGAKLEVPAICVGDVKTLGEVCDVSSPGWESVVFRQWRGILEAKTNAKECTTKAMERFIQTIMTDSDDEYVDARRVICRRLLVPEERRRVESKYLFEGVDEEAVTKLRISCHGRRFFVASNGGMGLVAGESQERDFVAVLPGARLPYSFRHRYDFASSEVELVGECFVHGMMKGEVFGRGTSFVKRDIRIC
ncbi:hypothetical protein CcaCcLH18_03206 [Colletotrichum camelliae]|nr:hypothetical protein CcaCcLH18_03206 [Colletotrichum camelliae]